MQTHAAQESRKLAIGSTRPRTYLHCVRNRPFLQTERYNRIQVKWFCIRAICFDLKSMGGDPGVELERLVLVDPCLSAISGTRP
jgi:hypothetical protein